MGRGSSDNVSAETPVAAEAARPAVTAISTRPAQGAYDQDDLLYFSGGHLPPRGLRLLNSGSTYVSVHARRDGTFQVQRQVQHAKGHVVGLGPLQIELLHEGDDLARAVSVAEAAREELSDAGYRQDGASNPDPPTLEGLTRTLGVLVDLRRRSREHRGPAFVDASYVEKLRAEGRPARLIEIAERARDTNPTAVDREALPPRRTR